MALNHPIGRILIIFESLSMSFNSSVLIPTAVVAAVGAIVLSVTGFQAPLELVFIIGAVLAGLANGISSPSSTAAKAETTTLYVGNLPYRANEGSVRELFSEHGKVFSVRLLRDKQTGKRRGFGFVEVATSDSKAIIKTLNDFEFQERLLKVRLANEK